jgi:hypothetical protein
MSEQIEIIEDRVYVKVDETQIEVVSVGIQGPPGPPRTTEAAPREPITTSSPPDPEAAIPTTQPQPQKSVLDRITDVILSPLELLATRR